MRVFFGIFCLTFGSFLFFYSAYGLVKLEFESEYKQGQIDAINGKVQYELKTMPDNSIQWVRK